MSNIKKYPSGELKIEKDYGNIFYLQDSDSILAFLLSLPELSFTRVTIPYLPFAREDKIVEDRVFTLKAFCDYMNYHRRGAILYDVHSDVSLALLNNVEHIEQYTIVNDNFVLEGIDYLISPDLGAAKKTQKLSDITGIPMLQCTKKRNPQTGQLSSFELLANSSLLENKTVLVVDDICDGGGTFIEVSKLLPASCTKFLYVTHGLFTKGLDVLRPYYKEVWTTNTIKREKDTTGFLIEREIICE